MPLSTNSKQRTALRPRSFVFAHRRAATIAMFIVCASLATVFVWRKALAANVLFAVSNGQAWLTTGNWTGGAVPTGTDVAQFGVNPTSGTVGVGINFNGTTNAGTQTLGQKIEEVGAVEITSARAAALLIGNSSSTAGATGTFRLNGAAVNSVAHVVLRNNSSQLLTLQNTQGSGTQTMSVALNDPTDNIINIDGTGGITFTSIIKNANGSHITLGGAGTGTLTLSAANTYTGGTTINSAKAVATVNGALGTGNVTVNTTGVGLTLQGANNNLIADTATVSIATGAKMALNQTGGSDTVGALILGGVPQASGGTYGSSASGATFVNDTFFSGTGTLTLPGGSTNPSGTGAANPSSVLAGNSTLLTVTVTPGTNPASPVTSVTGDLTSIGGSATQQFFDNGINGDASAGDNIYSFQATVPANTTGGGKNLPITITDALARTGNASIALTVLVPTPPTGTGTANPSSLFAGGSTTLTVNVTPGTNPASTGLAVTADLSSIGGSAAQAFSGSGNTFTFNATVSNATTPGTKTIPFTITDGQSRSSNGTISLLVKTPLPPNNVVISQVYGGGGNTGADFTNDFIELINHSSAPVSLNGWSVQAFIGGTWLVTPLTNVTLQPGQYYLIQESQGAGGTVPLPTPDAIGTITVSSTSGKVALVNNTTQLTGTCPDADAGAGGIVDFIGYGAANASDCFEGSTGPAPTLDNLTAAQRRNEGCFDTNDNAVDFITGEPNPRNSSSPTHDCTTLFGYGSASPASVLVGNSVALTVHVLPGQNPDSTGLTVTADLSAIGGSPAQIFGGGGNTFTFNATVPLSTTGGFKSLPVSITDGQGRSFSTSIVLSVLPLIADHVTISQLYGGGGNAGPPAATYQNDYVELYNPTGAPVSVTGWSIQYASATGSSWTNKQPIGGIIPPGQYLLVGLGSGGATGAALPASQITGSINMSATTGKLALVKNSHTLTGTCPLGTDLDIVDFVGYGSTANCHEGNANTPAPSNNTAIFRKTNGSQDTDQNGNDFVTGAPNPRQTAPIIELGPWVASTDPLTGATTAPHDATVTIDFSEPVNVDPGWYNINCASTGLHNDATVATAFGGKTYAITPNTNFQFGEQCTVTVFKTAIHDQDLDDAGPDTDNLFQDYVWSFNVVGAGQPAPYPPSVHLTMGDPGCGNIGCAVASTSQPDNYLMEKPTYSLSYNRDKGTPNWVSWHLEPAWYGTLARVDVFRPDPAVPPDWYRVQAFDYSGSGFDRGHMTPNADRDNQNRLPINQETYLMTNMVPQAPGNNQGPWAALEAELRTIADGGKELYIVSGPLGVGGTGSNGGVTTNVANGNVTVPAFTWKVALVLAKDDGDDLARVNCSTRTIAVMMPNQDSIRPNPWQNYLTSVDSIEQQTGYDFFSNVPAGIQRCIQAGVNGVNPPGTIDQSASTPEDNSVSLTLRGFQANNNALTFTITHGTTSGTLGAVGPVSCSNAICTANVSYSPNPDFNGSDSFTFKVNDGAHDSGESTFSIAVSEVNDSPTASDDSKSTSEDTQLSFPAADLTANDSTGPANESAQTLTVTQVNTTANTHGTVGLAAGIVTYNPDGNYNGPASFTYTACDNGTTSGSLDSKCSNATVNVTVNPVNDAPTANSQSLNTNEDNGISITLTGSDIETAPGALQFTITQGPSHGTLSGTAPNLSYSPTGNYNGPDTIKFTITDGGDGSSAALTSNEATVNITVNPVNDAPAANPQSVATNANTPVNITLTGSDVETAANALAFNVSTGPFHGTLSGSGANRTYTPFGNYSGPDSFTFTVTDNGDGSSAALTSAPATVSIVVNDTVPPVITLNGNSISLWPVNKSMRTVNVSDLVEGASDNFDPNVNLSSVFIASVSSDEGTAASEDIVIAGDCKSVQLRATRDGNGDGRVYTITFHARDAAGNTSSVTTLVTVPHDQGNGAAVDSGAAYTVNSNCP